MDKRTFIAKNYGDLMRISKDVMSELFKASLPLRITIQPDKETRSDKQNRLYWMWVDELAKATNTDKTRVHIGMRFKFLPTDPFSKPLIVDGQQIAKWPKSTTDLNTKEFAEYLQQIEAMAAVDLGIKLPQPEDLYWESLGVKNERAH